jgi:hypothetical protein
VALRYRPALVAGVLPLALALTACKSHDTGGGVIGPGGTGSAATIASGPAATFVKDPTACKLLPVSEVTSLVHPPGPLQADGTLQNAGSFGQHAKCKVATADGQHGVTIDLYRFPDKASATGAFKVFTGGADLVVTGLGDQAMRSFEDLFILNGTDVLKLTYLEPFDANMQSDSHQSSIGKILVPLGQLAVQGLGGLPAFSPTTSTSTTVRSHTTTTKRR